MTLYSNYLHYLFSVPRFSRHFIGASRQTMSQGGEGSLHGFAR